MKHPPSTPERPSPSNQAVEKAILALQMQRLNEAERLASDVSSRIVAMSSQRKFSDAALFDAEPPHEAIDLLQKAARRSNDPEMYAWLRIQCCDVQNYYECP
jgi:hypothetical protein